MPSRCRRIIDRADVGLATRLSLRQLAYRLERRILQMRKVVFGGANSLDNYLARADLELNECRAFRSGCAYVTYRVKHSA